MKIPPRIEIIAGRDRRFDQYIFRRFGHKHQVRVFAPIIFAPSEVKLETARWDVLEQEQANWDTPSRDDRRTVLEMRGEDWEGANGQQAEVIGTVEGGFYDSSNLILPDLALRMTRMAVHRAGDLHRASLENVFRTIARSAMTMLRADAASLHFARDDEKSDTHYIHYIYEVREGHFFRSVTSPRSNGLGTQALQTKRPLFVPDSARGQDERYLREFYPEAYDEGMRAEAAIPIFFSDESDAFYADRGRDARKPEKQGLLYVRFQRPHSFTKAEIDWLELPADRATEAIRQAAADTKARDRARRLDDMHRITRSLAEDPGSPLLLEDIAGVALNVLAADIVSVFEYDEQEKRFVSSRPTTAGRLIEADLVTALVEEMSAPALLLKKPEPIYEYDAASHPILSAKRDTDQFAKSFVARERIKSAAALILRGGTPAEREQQKEEIWGLMFVNYRTAHHFTAEDQKLTEILASSAAIALRNRRYDKAIRTIGAALSRAAAAEIAPDIERTEQALRVIVGASIREALATPRAVNYEGVLLIDVIRSDKSVVACEEGERVFAWLERGQEFELTVQFTPEKPITKFSEHGIVKAISIKGGDDQPQTVSFRLLVDFGFIEIPLQERLIPVPRHSPSKIARFPFLVPSAGSATPGSLETSAWPEICVSVYQNARYFDSCVLPLRVQL